MERVPIKDDFDATRRPDGYRGGVTTLTANYTATKDDHGKVFLASAAGTGVTVTLPADVAQGFRLTLMKANATTDLFLQCPAGQKINFGTAAKMYKSVTDGDGVPVFAEVISDGTDWFVVSQVGTWANDNS